MHHVIHLVNDSQRISALSTGDEPDGVSARCRCQPCDAAALFSVALFIFFFKILSKRSGQIIIITHRRDVFGALNERTAVNFTHLRSVISYLLTC